MGNPVKNRFGGDSSDEESSCELQPGEDWLEAVKGNHLTKGDADKWANEEFVQWILFDHKLQASLHAAHDQGLFELCEAYDPYIFFNRKLEAVADTYVHHVGSKGRIKFHWSGGGGESFEFHGIDVMSKTWVPFRHGIMNHANMTRPSLLRPLPPPVDPRHSTTWQDYPSTWRVGFGGPIIPLGVMSVLPTFQVQFISGRFQFLVGEEAF